MKILVTGTAGFIGFHTFLALRAAGHDVLGVDNLNSYNDVRLKLARLKMSGFDIDEILLDQVIESSQGGRFAKIDQLVAAGEDRQVEIPQRGFLFFQQITARSIFEINKLQVDFEFL